MPAPLQSSSSIVDEHTHQTVEYFDATSCRTGVHALKAFETWLGEHKSEGRTLELNVASLVLGQRQLQRFVQLATDYGWQLDGLKTQSHVTRQLALQMNLRVVKDDAPVENSVKLPGASIAGQYATPKVSAPSSSFTIGPATKQSALTNELTPLPLQPSTAEATLCVQSHLRSGQSLDYEGTVVLIGDAHRGSEIRATGNIIVWGELLGMAHAGCLGNAKAEIRALRLDALQLRIADTLARRPDQWAHEPFLANTPSIEGARDATWRGEVARVVNGEIQVFHGDAHATSSGWV